MTWLQAVPPAGRPTVLAGERTLLAHWGQPRTGLPPCPARSLSEDEEEAIAHLQAGDATPDLALAPVVATAVFAAERQAMHPDTRCALHQWGLARELHRGDPPVAALAAWRHQMLMTAPDWSDQRAQTPAEVLVANGWPPAALQGGVHAAIDVRVVTDAQGRFATGKVSARRLTVPGVVDQPPVAFETLFDAASVAKAAVQFKPVPPPAGKTSGLAVIQINWSLQ
jgi:hypothetical protein